MFKKFAMLVAFVCGFTVLMITLASAQVTAPIPSFFLTPKYLAPRNISGTPLKSVYYAGIVDTAQTVIMIGSVVDTFYSQCYHAIVHFNVSLQNQPNKATSYLDTLRHGVEYPLPKVSYDGIRDSVLLVVLNATTGVKPGDRFEVSIREAPWKILTYLDSIFVGDTTKVAVDTTSTVKARESRLFEPWD